MPKTILFMVCIYTAIRWLMLTETVHIECFDIHWFQWFLCGFRPCQLYKPDDSPMFAYCKKCGVPTVAIDERMY